jgi:DNA-binding MarR family transcriptional regulator
MSDKHPFSDVIPASSTPADLIYALVDLTFAAAHRTNALVSKVLADLELSHPLANALWKLDPDGKAPSMKELAAGLRCDPSTVTFLADRLEEKGLVRRRVNARNRRVKTLVLTAKGRDFRRRLVLAMATHTPAALLPPEEQEQLYRLLSKAMAASDAEWVPAPAPKSAETMGWRRRALGCSDDKAT